MNVISLNVIFISIKWHNSLNVKLSNLQLNKLKFAIKNESEVVLRLSANMIGDDETNFLHKLLLTDRQVANILKAFTNKSSTYIKLSKTQLSKMIQSGEFLGRLLGPLLKTGLPLIKPLAKSISIPLGLTAAASAADACIQKKILGSGNHSSCTTLIISNNEMRDINKIEESLEDSGLLLKGANETVQNKAREQKGGFLSMLLSTLGASLLGNILTGQGAIAKSRRRRINRAGKGRGINRADEGVIRAGYGRRSLNSSKKKLTFNAAPSFNKFSYTKI